MITDTETLSRDQPPTPQHPLEEAHLLAVEQDWCPHCSIDENAEPGVPVDIISTSIETEVQNIDGTGPTYLVQELSCGHHLATLQGPNLVLDDVA